MDAEPTAAAAFALLSDETRVDVLRAVARAHADLVRDGIETGETETLSATLPFSELYERVDVENTSKLSYHLGELTGTFLRKSQDGYALTHAGERLVRFVLAENYRPPGQVGPVAVEGTCIYCAETDLVATLSDQFLIVRCQACERPVAGYETTPAQTRSHEGADLVESFVLTQATDYIQVQRGTCPACGGGTDTDVVAIEPAELSETGELLLSVDECPECLRIYSLPLVYAAVWHPASIAFHWNHGIDVLATGPWELNQHLRERRWTANRVGQSRSGDDRTEYMVELRRNDDVLRAYLDGAADVVRTEIVRGRAVD